MIGIFLAVGTLAALSQTNSPAKLAGKTCIAASEIAQGAGSESTLDANLNKDVCVRAHVYSVVELADGTRFLDVCPADVADEQCRFTLVSLRTDREEVGDLRKFRDQDVSVRGVIRATHGRKGILISHIRQFSGGPEKFRPNPKLLRDFNAESDHMPVRDPGLSGGGKHRSFMNNGDREALPSGQKH
jgi:hypothetical protein